MVAGTRKIQSVVVYPKGVEGSPETFENVDSWRVGYNGILVMKGKDWTEVLAPDLWNRIQVIEK